MTFGKRPQQERNLDGKQVHQLWLEFGNIARVNAKLFSEGVVSPRTGRKYTVAALTLSAWRWCIKNPVESFEITKQYRESHGETLVMADWYKELIVHARNSLTPTGYSNFLQGNNLEDRARSIR